MNNKPKRKTIQIATTTWIDELIVVALCDDGMIFRYNLETDSWKQLPPIPERMRS